MSIPINSKLRWSRYGVLMHWCPGCELRHIVHIGEPNAQGAQWHYTGDHDNPTLTPSVNINLGDNRRCHYFLKHGFLQFCEDSTHALAGKKVSLPDFPVQLYDDVVAPEPKIARITCVAVRADGVVYSLSPPSRHHNVIHTYALGAMRSFSEDYEEGFLDSDGKFLGRLEAMTIAVASGQFKRKVFPGCYNGPELYSEDLW